MTQAVINRVKSSNRYQGFRRCASVFHHRQHAFMYSWYRLFEFVVIPTETRTPNRAPSSSWIPGTGFRIFPFVFFLSAANNLLIFGRRPKIMTFYKCVNFYTYVYLLRYKGDGIFFSSIFGIFRFQRWHEKKTVFPFNFYVPPSIHMYF